MNRCGFFIGSRVKLRRWLYGSGLGFRSRTCNLLQGIRSRVLQIAVRHVVPHADKGHAGNHQLRHDEREKIAPEFPPPYALGASCLRIP